MKEVIKTERLRLRTMQPEDLDNLQKIFSDPEAMRYYPSLKDSEETKEWIDWTRGNYMKYGVGLWVVEKLPDNSFVGMCGLVPQMVEGKMELEVGYLFVRTAWGKGFATEAAKACVDYGFKQVKCHQIISLIDPGNEASIKVANRVGMAFDRVIEKWDKKLSLYKIEDKRHF
ncbi:GNAT family N-acetyltransferase [Sediminibacillus massiliensis]|uniref:GNAT family N-acetyltransferase n=1 Tax=Sediminibacillus massiliensis TaxID=1926277 RepID=UPI0009885B12|nr:GNAT family N-acetyltransferase [Sediminibacillus massiliensis]